MTLTKKQKRERRQLSQKVRFLEMDTLVFMTILKFPKKTLISVSEIKEKVRRALKNEFKETEIII